jgi:gamma-glutamyltranspeptidase/glutathione hydrolase
MGRHGGSGDDSTSAEKVPVGRQISGAQAVATNEPPATAAALAMLADGGNAFDAGVTGTLLLSVLDGSGFCFGGEVPIIVRPAGEEEPLVVCGQGPAPARATPEFFVRWGGIPQGGRALLAAAVPGQLDACLLVLERWGTQTFERCAEPTLRYLEGSDEDWKLRLASTLHRLIEEEKRDGIDGVRASFYGGEIGRELAQWCQENGGLIAVNDLAVYRARVEQPVHRSYRGCEVYKCGTWTQGPSLLQMLAILENSDLRGMGHNSADYLHHLIEAMKLGFADRDAYYGDPDFVGVPLDRLLSDDYARDRCKLIDPRRASMEQRPGSPGELGITTPRIGEGRPNRDPQDTTTCVTADDHGNIFVATPSGWGLEMEPGPTGIWLGTRLQSLNIWKGHPNCIAPGKRPRITLTPTLVLREGRPLIAISVAGGDHQDQATLNILLAHLDFGLTPQEAMDAPRVATAHMVNSFGQGALTPGRMSAEEGVADDVVADLRERGHLVDRTNEWIGYAVVIGFDGPRLLPAGRSEGLAGVL